MALRDLFMASVIGLTFVAWPGTGASQNRTDESKLLQGLWRGSWGAGERNGVVFQPVIAEMIVEGERVEISDFPQVRKLTGTVRLDAGTRQIKFTPKPPPDDQPALKAVEYTFEIAGDKLTLRDGDKLALELQKLPVVANPLANIHVELVTAAGFNEAGDLLVNRVTALNANATGTTYFQSGQQVLSTKQGTVFVVQETGMKSVTIEAARRLVREAPPVVVTLRQDERLPQPQSNELWKDVGSAPPDSEAVLQTYARLLRPGTLVFVLSARENIPRP